MSAYISRLNDAVTMESDIRRVVQATQARDAKQSARARLTPLDARLERLLTTIPTEVQREGLSLSTLQASLRGRWRGNCHPGELGAALRRLGFVRRRRWAPEAGFSAVWSPQKSL